MSKKLRTLLLIMAALVVPWVTQAQVASSCSFRTGVDATRWITLTSAATTLTFSGTDDGVSALQNIGFTFNIGEESYTQFSANTNGRMRLGPAAIGTTYSIPFSASNATLNMPQMAPYGRDQSINAPSQYVKYELTGTAPNRILVIETAQGNGITTNVEAHYQVQIYEDSSKIVFVYGSNTGTMSSCQIGVGITSTDIITIDPATNTTALGTTSTTTSTWPGNGRYYEMVFPIANCRSPRLSPSLATIDSAYLSWTGGGTSWLFEYADSAFTPGMNQATSVLLTDSSYALDNLTARTTYYYAARAICGAGDSSFWTSGSVTTLCNPTPVPYAYGFEANDTTGAAGCWDAGRQNTTSSYPYLGYSTSSSYQGARCMYGYISSDATIYTWAAMPNLTAPLDSLMISFYMKSSSTSYTAPLQIGYMTNSSDAATFVPLASLTPTTSYERYVVAFPDTVAYPAASRIAFMYHSADGASNYIYLDNVSVEYKPTCPAAVDLTVATSAGAAVLTWGHDASCFNEPEGYNVVYAPAGDLTSTVAATATGTGYVITGLTADSSYKVWVTPNCGMDGYGYADSAVFTTGSLPCAVFNPSTDTVTVGTGTFTSYSYPFPSIWYYRFLEMLYTHAEMGDSAMNITQFSMQRSASYSGDVDILSDVDVYFANVDTTLTSLSSSFVQQDSRFQLVKHGMNFTGTGWIDFQLDQPFYYNGQGGLLVAMKIHASEYISSMSFYYTSATGMVRYSDNDYNAYNPATVTGGYTSSYRTDMRFVSRECDQLSTCAAPAVSVDSLSDTALHASWAPGYQESEWDVYYKRHDAETWQLYAAGLTTTDILVTGLHSGTKYDVGVMGICEDSLMGSATVTTDCGPIYRNNLPYTADFSQSSPTSTMANCWSRYNNSGNSYPYISTYNGVPDLYYYLSSATNYAEAITPEVEMSADSLELSFDYYKGSSGYSPLVVVGVMTDPAVDSTFVPVDSLTCNAVGRWTGMEADLGSYTGTGHYVALRYCYSSASTTDYNYLYISNVQIFKRSSCRKPSAAYASNVTYESAQVNLLDEDNTDANSYVVYYGTGSDLASCTDSLAFTGLTATLTGLAYQTDYNCWVRVQCSDAVSRYRTFSFTTKPPCVEVSDLTAQNSTVNNTALLSWGIPTEGFTVTEYVVSYKGAEDTVWTNDTTTANYYLITGVAPGTAYQYKVTTLCDTIVGTENSGTFSSLPQCSTIQDADASSVSLPMNGYYGYGYTQSLYTSAELTTMGDTISGLYYHQVTTGLDPATFTIDVYLGSTDTDAFAGTSAWLPASAMTRVVTNYSWTTATDAGWVYIPLDSVFVRNHGKNLVVAIDNNTGSYIYPYPVWTQTAVSTARSIYFAEDGNDMDPANPGTANGTLRYVPDVSFATSCLSTTCGTPMIISTARTEHSLDLRWYPGAAETSWTIDYRLLGDTTWINFLTNTAATDSTLTGLVNGMTYEVRIQNPCSTDSTYSLVREFATECGLAAVPCTENFDNQPNGTYAHYCWETGTDGTALPSVSNLVSYGKMAQMGSGAYLIAPDLAAAVNTLQMHLTYWGTSARSFIYVGVIRDPSSVQTFVPIDTLTTYDVSMRSSKTVHFDGYTDTVGNICIYMPAGYPVSGQFFIDDIVIEPNLNCPDVDSVWSSNETATSVTVNWNMSDHGTASSYIVEYGISGFTQGTGTVATTSSSFVALSGLVNSTLYDVYITPICSTGDTTYTSSLARFQTACEAATVPYEMNFDLSYLSALSSTHQMPTCWKYDMNYSGSDAINYAPQILWDDNYSQSGRNCLYLYYTAVTALPEMNAPIDTLQVSFYAYTYSNYYELVVGVVDSLTPGFAASFVPVDTINGYNGVTDTVTFCGYTGSGQYIAFKNQYSSGSSSASIYLDDVKVEYRPACMPVKNIVRDTASQTMIGLHWSACGHQLGYQVEYGVHGFVQGHGTTLTTATTSATLTGLTGTTQYDIYVRNICSATDTGAWVKAIMGTKACNDAVELSMFDTNATSTATQYFPGYSFFNYSYTQVIYDSAMMADQGFIAGSAVTGFAFNATVTTAGNYFNNCSVLMKNTAKAVFASETDFDTMAVSNLVYTGNLNWSAVGWRYAEFSTPFVWDGHSNVIIAIDRNNGTWSSGARISATAGTAYRAIYSYSDSYNVDPYTLSGISSSSNDRVTTIPDYKLYGCLGTVCATPAVTVASHTYEQATLSWTGDAASYEAGVKAVTAAVWPASTAVTVATATFSGLQPATTYNYRVRAICDTATQSEWAEGTFVTDSLPCFAPTNLSAAADFGTAEMSWTPGTTETQWNLHVWNTTYDHTYAVSSNPATATGLTPGVTYNAAIAAVCGGGLIVSGYSDTISFTTAICAPVTGVTVGTVTGSTAQVSWTPGANNTGSYQIEYGNAGFGSGDGTIVSATTNSVTLTGLESDNEYDVYVRAVCDSQYPSVWSASATFTTLNVGIATADGERSVSIYPNPATNGTTISVSGVEGEVTVTLVDMNGRTLATYTLNCAGDCAKQVNVSTLASGAYFVRIQGDGLNTVKKLIVK